MAVFLAIGGLLSGLIWRSVFVAIPAGIVREQRVSDSATLISRAEGAEVDSAALTPKSAPFLASANSGDDDQVAQNMDILYGKGAVRDPGQVVKTKTTASKSANAKALAAGVIYTAVPGDTIASISIAFGVPVDTIVEFNSSVNFSPLLPGVSIVIPDPKSLASFAG